VRKVLRKLIGLLPNRFVRAVGRLQFTVPILAPVIRKFASNLASGEGVIQSGVGQGLKFDATYGYAGYILGTSEPEEQDLLARVLRPGMVFYDLGANVGFYTILGAKLVGEQGKVFAMEPTPRLAEAVRANAARNAFTNVTVVQVAAGEREGTAKFVDTEFSAGNRVARDGADEGEATFEVRVTSVDAYVRETGAPLPDVVMMDVEGAEIDALRGMRETLAAAKPVILCEVHWQGERMIACFDEVLKPLGYTMRTYSGEPVPEGYVRYHALITPPQGAVV